MRRYHLTIQTKVYRFFCFMVHVSLHLGLLLFLPPHWPLITGRLSRKQRHNPLFPPDCPALLVARGCLPRRPSQQAECVHACDWYFCLWLTLCGCICVWERVREREKERATPPLPQHLLTSRLINNSSAIRGPCSRRALVGALQKKRRGL